MKKNTQAFTLVELLLVIGIIATLAVVAFVALNPAKRFADARDARRVSDLETILSAVHQYTIDNKGMLPDGITASQLMIGDANGGCELGFGGCGDPGSSVCLHLSDTLNHYLKAMPYDPGKGNPTQTHYAIQADSNGIVTVTACDAEGGQISTSR